MTVQTADEPWFREPETTPDELLGRFTPEEVVAHFRGLQSVTAAVLAHLNLPDLLQELLARVREVLQVDTATVLLCTPGGESLDVRASSGLEEEVEEGIRIPVGRGVAGSVAARRRAVIVDDVSRVETVSPWIRRLASMMVAPLLVEGRVLGILHVGTLRPRSFTDADLHFLQVVADRVALAVRNAALYEDAQAEIRARTAAEAELLDRHDLHHLLAETAADAIVTMDADSVIVSANPAATDVFGYPLEELIGRSMTDLIPARFRQAHRAGVLRYLATGERRIPWRGLELPGLHRSGREVLLEVAFAERTRDGQRFFTGTMRDITERKATERLLAAQYAVTRVLAETESVDAAVPGVLQAVCEAVGWQLGVFWIWDPAINALRMLDRWIAPGEEGQGFEALASSVTFAEGVGLPGRVRASRQPAWVADVTQDQNFPRLAAAARAGLHGAFAFPICVGGDCIGVAEFFTREVAEPDPGLLTAMEALGSDIGQFIRRKDAEERLRRREDVQSFLARTSIALAASALDFDSTLRRLAQQAVPTLADSCAVYIRRESGETERLAIVHADPELERLTRDLMRYPIDPSGRHPAVRVIETGTSLMLPEITDQFVEDLAFDAEHLEALRGMGMTSALAVPLTARGRTLGALVLISTRPEHRLGADDLEVAEEFAMRAALAVDNARLLRDAQAANRAKSEFMAVMSHELRTPLNAVIGYADLLKMGVGTESPGTSDDYVERISVSARHLAGLIEEILTFSRLEAGRDPVSAVPLELDEIGEEIRVIAEPLAREKGLRFAVIHPEEPVRIVSDPGKVRQIVLNLVSNAIKFTEEGSVEFEFRLDDGSAVIEVRDTGAGIDPELQERIFDPFWQVEQGTTRQAGGTGLGLTVTRKLVTLLGGDLRLQSAPGKGSTFAVRLPVQYRPRQPVDPTEPIVPDRSQPES